MRKLLAAGVVAVLLGFGNATGAEEPIVWRTSAPRNELGQAPAAAGKVSEAPIVRAACPCTASVPCAASAPCTSSVAPNACRHGHGCGHAGCLHRLCDWFTYRALPVPRECKCHRTCTSCTPPLYSYFAVRYAAYGHSGHAELGHVVAPAAPTTATPAQPYPRTPPVQLPPLQAR